ncbi:MAG: FAD:protein FMN transferase [Verrucomicrobiales bacterium]|nr:FAD:protein FMN transferase [Verrucomicrobiales bacterium]MCP5525446.1 FAD:protein FMN transferase [Verrucomicrobiales bacterium]
MTTPREAPLAVSVVLAAWALVLGSGCAPREHVLTGEAMGTTYRIKVVARSRPEAAGGAIRALLEELDRCLSTWREDSWISAFNRDSGARPARVPELVWPLLVEALELADETGGCFDPTIGGLVELWGFGPHASGDFCPPSDDEIRRKLESCGYRKVTLRGGDRTIAKLHPELALDLSAVAKGFAADRIGEALERQGYTRFLVEFGGEIVARGAPPGRRAWRVRTPHSSVPVLLADAALATSGSEHQQHDGLSHLIDPRSGKPVRPGVPVTIQARTGTRADGLATAEAIRRATTSCRPPEP